MGNNKDIPLQLSGFLVLISSLVFGLGGFTSNTNTMLVGLFGMVFANYVRHLPK